jgi:hypothetical protein
VRSIAVWVYHKILQHFTIRMRWSWLALAAKSRRCDALASTLTRQKLKPKSSTNSQLYIFHSQNSPRFGATSALGVRGGGDFFGFIYPLNFSIVSSAGRAAPPCRRCLVEPAAIPSTASRSANRILNAASGVCSCLLFINVIGLIRAPHSHCHANASSPTSARPHLPSQRQQLCA